MNGTIKKQIYLASKLDYQVILISIKLRDLGFENAAPILMMILSEASVESVG